VRRALIVGIDDYPNSLLKGCVRDAESMTALLAGHDDGEPNFACRTLIAPGGEVGRNTLWSQIQKLFAQPAEVALFYFAGHGLSRANLGGSLFAQDSRQLGGIPMGEVMALASAAPIREVLVILDCCYSGAFGFSSELKDDHVVLREGVSVLTASRSGETAGESEEGGLLTALLCEALGGGAADVRGIVTMTSLYAFVDQTLDAWDQRPMLKSYVSQLLPLRRCRPRVDLAILRKLPEYFESSMYERPLDPSYEPTAETHVPEKGKVFSALQKLRAAGVVEPTGGEEHLYFAAVNSKGCRLTPLGRFYWNMAKRHRL
jgi:hypothetical protein